MRIHVMHVPGVNRDRDQAVRVLQSQVDVCLHEDAHLRGVVPNHADAVRCANREKTDDEWYFFGQDDLMLIEGWKNEIDGALRNSPSKALALVNAGAEGRDAGKNGSAYEVGPYVLRGAWLAYHRTIVEPLGRFLTFAGYAGFDGDDTAANIWCWLNGITPARVVRSLGVHLGAKSTIGHTDTMVTRQRITSPELSHIRWDTQKPNWRRSESRDDVALLLRRMMATGWKPTQDEEERMSEIV